MSEETPRIVVTVAAPVEAVWDALRDKKKIQHWHGWEYEGLDAEIDLIFFTGFTADGETHTLELHGGDRFVVEPQEGGSKITLTRAPHGDDPAWDAYYDDITEGWITFVQQLRFALERHPGDARRTLFYSGAGDRSTGPADQLGLDAAVGAVYAADLIGEAVTGQVWFRSEHQVGLTVDQWGDGLLVLSHVGASDKKANGAAMAVLTFYELSDNERAAIGKRWQDWWPQRYPATEELPPSS
ncbi:SRPBCC domain-containing protein [Streptomyces sp. SID13031]|uniref:SRPBCC family protein n=1 Tax=Streptomyces sp. SID13031 TaxID=2706046 RepID=UPI0013CC4FFD|nr:SRPBCC domain-containing protein [Streptomyces sp. SID13031]NEA31113.1 SRPBCC domain-containing protein [Streptomyces sp. SID13031]